MTDYQRVRRIVQLASERAENVHNQEWFRRDEKGFWERRAAELLDQSAGRAKDLKLSESQVDEQCAVFLNLLACEALIKKG